MPMSTCNRRICEEMTQAAPNIWHSFDFAFDTSVSWMVNYGSEGPWQLATMNEIKSVLANVTGMDITGETWTGINETT